jgi:hypothetical protein
MQRNPSVKDKMSVYTAVYWPVNEKKLTKSLKTPVVERRRRARHL